MSIVLYQGTVVEKLSSAKYKVEPSAYDVALNLLYGEDYKYFENGEYSIMLGGTLLLDVPEVEKHPDGSISFLFNHESDLFISDLNSNVSSLEIDSGDYNGHVGDLIKILDNRPEPPQPTENGIATSIIRFDNNMTVLVKYNKDTQELSYEIVGG